MAAQTTLSLQPGHLENPDPKVGVAHGNRENSDLKVGDTPPGGGGGLVARPRGRKGSPLPIPAIIASTAIAVAGDGPAATPAGLSLQPPPARRHAALSPGSVWGLGAKPGAELFFAPRFFAPWAKLAYRLLNGGMQRTVRQGAETGQGAIRKTSFAPSFAPWDPYASHGVRPYRVQRCRRIPLKVKCFSKRVSLHNNRLYISFRQLHPAP